MKIVVVGMGYVGLACTCFTRLGHQVVGVDVDPQRIENLRQGVLPIVEPGLDEIVRSGIGNGSLAFTTDLAEALKEADVCFVCVGTPSGPEGQADLQFVESAVAQIQAVKGSTTLVVIKSTVPVGTSERLGTISNPEFLREGKAVEDFLHPDRIVIGTTNAADRQKLKVLYEPFACPIVFMSSTSSELTKYAANGFLATKISFANEIANLCDLLGADVRDVTKAIGLDPRIGSSFLQPGIGYGGSCFPKDVSALKHTASVHAYDFRLLDAVMAVNASQRARFINQIVGSRVAVWGLAFKAGTDDIRKSPAIEVVEALLKKGVEVTAYDPLAMPHAKALFGDRIRFGASATEVLPGADALVVLTEWPEFRDHAAMIPAGLPIYDARNLLADLDLPSYVGVGLGRAARA